MLNSIKLKTKKIIFSLLLFLAVSFSALSNNTFVKQDLEVQAKTTNRIVQDVTSSVFGTGYDFNVTTSDNPVSPSGWTKLESESTNIDNIKKGVVNVENETSFDTDECKTSRPSMPITDKDTTQNPSYYKNLMINSYNGAGKYGYKSSSSITLEANSFYRISVLLLTQKTDGVGNEDDTDARASIYLTGLLDKDDEGYSQTKYESLTTLGAWEEYYFYIDTNTEEKISLELWLGSKTSESAGAVFFNEVTILRYSEDAYTEQTKNLEDKNNDNINLISSKTTKNSPFVNGDFEDVSLNGWKRKAQSTSKPSDMLYKSVDASNFAYTDDDITISTPGTNCSVNNKNALFLYNKKDGYQALESQTFTINKQSFYKVSFWAKSNCNTGSGATVKLIDTAEKNPVESVSLTLSTTASEGSNKFRNDWTNYSFYIYGPSVSSKDLAVQIWLGTNESPTSGYVFVDDFTIETIDYTTYSTNSSSANSIAMNLNNSTDKYTIVNGNFDKIKSETFPATPDGWSQSGTDSKNSTIISGVVNTSSDSFNSIDFPAVAPLKPGALPHTNTDDNNVLMIGSTDETNSQYYESNSLTLSADSFYSLSFYVKTDYYRTNETKNYGPRVILSSSTTTLFDYFNLYYTNSGWHRVELKIKTGSVEVTPTLKLSFENTTGYVFFDQVELRTISEALYNDTMFEDRDTEYYRIDLNGENFDNRSYNKNLLNINRIETPNNWSLSDKNQESDGVNSGIISSDNELIYDIPSSISENTNYLYISSLHNTNVSYVSKNIHTFNSSTYYKISVNILTNYIFTEDDEEAKYGASFRLSDSSEIMFNNINTEGVWQTYTIYASFTETLSSSIALGLGYTDELVRGDVLFDNLNIEVIDEETYKSEVQEANPNKIATFINYTEPKDDETDTEDSSTWENKVNWLILPSLITALAIIIAVVGFYVRKISINRKPKIKTKYDRRRTLDKDIDRREKIALRQQIISELKTELDNIDKEIEDFNELANKHLEEIKAQIKKDQEELEKSKLEIEIKKKEATANREKQLKENAELISNKKAEKQYSDYIAKLDRQEFAIQKKISAKELKLNTATEVNKEKLSRYYERQEYIKLQIAKIEAEIEEIARQEEEIWAEYRAAKEDAKRRKAEYKAQLKHEKELAKKQKEKSKSPDKSKSSKNSPAKKQSTKKDVK